MAQIPIVAFQYLKGMVRKMEREHLQGLEGQKKGERLHIET